MQSYPVRRDHLSGLNAKSLLALAQDAFGSAEIDGEGVSARFGAIEALRATPRKKEIEIEVRMNPKVPVEVAAETVRRYNQFLERATGYSSKERAKRLRKSAGSPDAGA